MDAAAATREEAIGEDVPCRACGYNLRGLTGGGRCPECSEGIAGSVVAFVARRAGDLPLERCAPAWVGRIWWGCTLTLAGGGFAILVMVSNLVVVKHYTTMEGTGWSANLLSVLWSLRAKGSYATTVLIAAGLWLVSSPEPGSSGGAVERRAIRAGLVALCLVRGSWLLLRFGPYGPHDKSLLIWCDRTVTAAVTWGGLRVLARLAHRDDCRALGLGATALAWAIPLGALAQANWLRVFLFMEGMVWTVWPEPMFGALQAVPLVPFTLGVWPRVNAELVAWFNLAGVAVASGVVQIGVWRRLYRAKNRKSVENL